MDLTEAIKHAIDGNAVLFTGSGFSYGSQNLEKKSPMNGRDFAKFLFSECAVNDADDNLALASQLYVQKYGAAKLAELCRNTFSIRAPAEHHIEIMKLPWQRIYTTNYDDLLEKSSAENAKSLVPLTLEDLPEKYISSARICLHVNGFINKLSVLDLAGGFKLTAGSYLSDGLTGSNWAGVLRQDVRLARAVIFIGYSMYDLDIQRLFHAEDIKHKTIFITSPAPSSTDQIMLPLFGNVLPIGIQQLANSIATESLTYSRTKSKNVFIALEKIAAPSLSRQPNNADVEKLFLYGQIEQALLSPTNEDGNSRKYTIDRLSSTHISEVLKTTEDIVLVSDLGNGKTVALEQLSQNLAGLGWNVYRFTSDTKNSRQEAIQLLDLPGNTALIIDNYVPYLDFIDFVSIRRTGKNFRFILTGRSHVHEAFRDRLENSLRVTTFAEIDLNRLNRSEVNDIVELIDSYGLWAEFSAFSDIEKLNIVRAGCDGQLHQLLLKIYNSPHISEKISSLFLQLPSHLRRIAIAVFILKGSGLSSDRSILNELLKDAPLIRLSNTDRESVQFLWDDSTGHIRLKSSVLAEYYLTKLADASVVVEILLEMFLQALKLRNQSPEYEYFMRSIMSFSALQKLLPKNGLRGATIKFYEAIQSTEFTNRNPHYWLQYAIARLSFEDDLDEIAPYFKSSYALAKNINYDTYQIDNHYARFLMVKATREKNYELAYNLYLESKALLTKQMLHEKKHYPYRVAASINEFVRMHQPEITPHHRIEILNYSRDVINRIAQLPPEVRRHKHVTTCLTSLQSVISELS